MKFHEHKVDDIGKVVTGKTPRTAIPENYGDDILFLTPSEDFSFKYVNQTKKKLSNIGVKEVKNCLIPAQSICVTCIGSDLGQVIITTQPTVTNQQINSIIVNQEEFDKDFIYYQMILLGRELNYISKSSSTAVPIVNKSSFCKTKFRAPILTYQQKIGKILSDYDDLIELNRRRIAILEEMAMRTYQEWFVHFRFPGHETTEFINGLPAGWEEKMLGDVIEFDRGCSYTSEEIDVSEGVNLINLKNIQAYGGYNYDGLKLFSGTYKSRHIVKQGDLVMGVTDMTQDRRTVGAVALIPKYNETSIISTDLVKMRSEIPNIFLYCMFRFGGISKFVSEFANGSNVLHLKPTSIRKQWLCIPKDEIITAFDNFITPIVQEMESLTFQNFQLQKMRDRLLPQLMSGQLEVTTNDEAL